ncbi:uncharacterized protein LOC142162314 [Nicotiana tabacum]|uniref:Uncharacterized protein LOC142162314 n=1 Tax=Nicotiana tabacum TaxID=4097 RepID=A0AC58RPX7_TOBAC
MTLDKYYPDEFGELKLRDLSHQLDTFIVHMQHGGPRFSDLKGISDLEKALIEANLVETYSLVYLLVKLTLILPVATATVKRAFSSMKYIKDELRSSIGDAFLNDYLFCYFEKEVFTNVSNDAIIDRFQSMKKRPIQYPDQQPYSAPPTPISALLLQSFWGSHSIRHSQSQFPQSQHSD